MPNIETVNDVLKELDRVRNALVRLQGGASNEVIELLQNYETRLLNLPVKYN